MPVQRKVRSTDLEDQKPGGLSLGSHLGDCRPQKLPGTQLIREVGRRRLHIPSSHSQQTYAVQYGWIVVEPDDSLCRELLLRRRQSHNRDAINLNSGLRSETGPVNAASQPALSRGCLGQSPAV